MSKFKQLINPHSHSHHSLDGAATVEQIVKRNKELGATHTCLTEHGNLNGSLELYEACKGAGVKPIVGVELYVEPFFKEELRSIILASGTDPEKVDKELAGHYTHLTVHFKDEWAYQYFCKLTPIMDQRSITKVGEKKPVCTLEELSGAAGHITIGSGCLASSVNKWLDPMKNKSVIRYDLAERAYQILRSIAGPGNFFVEVFPHCVTHNWKRSKIDNKTKAIIEQGHFEEIGCSDLAPDGDIQKSANKFILEMAKKYKDPVIISLDSHYATEIQKLVQDVRLGNGLGRWKFHEHLYVMSTDTAAENLQHNLGVDDKTIQSWIDNSYLFASKFDNFKMTTAKDRWILAHTPEDYRKKLVTSIQKAGRMDWSNPEMVKQLEYEVKTLGENGMFNLVPYTYPLEKVADYCRENDILMNVRGSAGGSLLFYVLGISAVNPLKHDLSFDRFITPGRIKARTLPDCDVDLPTGDRDRVIEFLETVYGDKICRISVDIQMKMKSALRDVERALKGSVSKETEILCKKLPKNMNNLPEDKFVFGYTDDDGTEVDGIVDNFEPLQKYITAHPDIWESVKEVLGITRQKSPHPCGYVIADKPVQDYCPIMRSGNIKMTGFSPKSVEKAGLVKYDFLGLNTLKDIQGTIRLIKQRKGIKIDPFVLPHDENIYQKIFHTGDTASIFQFDSDVVRPGLILIKPNDIDGLSVVTALYRPGTMDAPSGDGRRTLTEVYGARANGEAVTYLHPSLEPILRDTYGINVFQEQTLRIFRDIGGYSAEEAEIARRGIGKKDPKVLAEITRPLRERCVANGWTEEQAKLLTQQISASARYSFNKSHATSYAYTAYACAYLRYHYPFEWWTAVLSNSSKEDLQKYWPKVANIVMFPDVNISTDQFEIVEVDGQDKIRAPLSLIDGVGPSTITEVLRCRPFKDMGDMITRVNRQIIRKDVVYPLILAGAMDSLFVKTHSYYDKIKDYELLKATIAGKKNPDPIPAWLLNMNPLQYYLMKKKVFKVYSEDLFYIAKDKLAGMGLIKPMFDGKFYTYSSPDKYLDGVVVANYPMFKDIMSGSLFSKNGKVDLGSGFKFAAIGYVLDTEEKEFMGFASKDSPEKVPKSFMKISFEVGSDSATGIKWPDYRSDKHGVDKKIDSSVCLFVLQKKENGDLAIKKLVSIASLEESNGV